MTRGNLLVKKFKNILVVKNVKILHIEDSKNDAELIHSIIESGDITHDYRLVDNEKDFIHILETEKIDLILSDYSLPDYNGNDALKITRKKYAQIPFIFVSGKIGEDGAIQAMLDGATDYVLKNKLERLVPAIKRALLESETQNKREQAEWNLKEKTEEVEAQNVKHLQINKTLDFQNEEKGKRAAELIIAHKELVFQNREKENRADELIIANKELAYQNVEKEKRAAELIIANNKLAFQNKEKEKRAQELIIANKELAYQNNEKERRADELVMANKELAYQNEEKEKRADELIIANKELAYQNEEKEKRADELIIANKELAFQNREKEKRADELFMANKELAFQNEEKEKRAKELIIANKELLFQNEEKEKRAAELVKAREKAEESDNLKTAFLNNLSHEIRTPMNQILGFASFLNAPETTVFQRDEYIDIINSQSQQLLQIISDVVEISEITTGQVALKPATFNLGEMLNELLATLQPKAEQRNLRLSLNKKIADSDSFIRGDRAKLKHILGHLIENAIKFTDTGSILVEYDRVGEKLVFSVKDTGIGIEEQKKQVIFDQFRQVETTLARKYGGLGLGLSISKAYIGMMAGIIRVESEPDKGSTFFVEIPYISSIQMTYQTPVTVQPPVEEPADWSDKTLLIAEDEESNIQFLRAVLRSTGIQMLFAGNGFEAIEQCRSHPEIVVILMDIKMPRMDGLEATKIIKSFRTDLPIIAITAYAKTNEKEQILKAGCTDYLPKPFKREDLIVKIRNSFHHTQIPVFAS